MTVVDLNEDGRLDIVAGINTAWDLKARQDGPALAIWLNEGPREPDSPALRDKFGPTGEVSGVITGSW